MQGTKNLAAINAALQNAARHAGGSVTPPEANKRLEQLGLLKDSKAHPGKPLRDLLRKKQIDGAWQDGSRRWHIDAIDGKDSTRT